MFTDVNGDGRPDLYVANDEDPNRLYLNEPGGPLGFHFVEDGAPVRASPTRTPAWASPRGLHGRRPARPLRHELARPGARGVTSATAGSRSRTSAPSFAPAVGQTSTGWGDSWVDLANDGRARSRARERRHPGHEPRRRTPRRSRCSRTEAAGSPTSTRPSAALGPLVNGRGLAAADYDNDGRVDIAVNSIGGKLILLHNTGAARATGSRCSLTPFAPGAVVTAVDCPDGTRLVREVQAGSSYLSSEDPRVHFGLGKATTGEAS